MGLVTFGRGLLYHNTQSSAISSVQMSRGSASGMIAFIQLMFGTTFTQSMPFLLDLGVTYVFGSIMLAVIFAHIAHQYALFQHRRS